MFVTTSLYNLKSRLFWVIIILSLLKMNAYAGEYWWVGGTGDWSDLSMWRTDMSGGTVVPNSTPILTDTVYFDANSFSASGQSVTLDQNVSLTIMDWSTCTNAPKFKGSGSYTVTIYDELVLSTDMTFGTTKPAIDMVGNGTHSITTGEVSIGDLTISGSGTFNQQDSLNCSALDFTGSGTYNTNNHGIRCSTPTCTNIAFTFNLGTSTVSYDQYFYFDVEDVTVNGANSIIHGRTSNTTKFYSHSSNATYGLISSNKELDMVKVKDAQIDSIYADGNLKQGGPSFGGNTINKGIYVKGNVKLDRTDNNTINGPCISTGEFEFSGEANDNKFSDITCTQLSFSGADNNDIGNVSCTIFELTSTSSGNTLDTVVASSTSSSKTNSIEATTTFESFTSYTNTAFSGSCTFGDLKFLGEGASYIYQLGHSGTSTISGMFQINSNGCFLNSLRSASSGTAAKININGPDVSFDFVNLQDVDFTGGSAIINGGGNSVDNGNVTGVNITGEDWTTTIGLNKICYDGASIYLSPGGHAFAQSFTWNNGATTDSISVSSEGVYWVDVSYGINCLQRDTFDVNLNYVQLIYDTICDGDTLTFGAQSLTAAGTYTEVFSTVAGCDSVLILTRAIK